MSGALDLVGWGTRILVLVRFGHRGKCSTRCA
uniref:Uncharacterized protein n=1 Tax=Arundo donax TaxID=35708 RepID=A0A0A8ZR73_ARUDO